ncbi:MAG TPA: hypothetical protein VNE63_16390 [Candidatus Acidoferrales bacterium]|nr:hypothetical protein [Candidatus Acidoferrales bacterium]
MSLDAESEHIREVYAHFGLAMYLAQNLERGLAMLLAVIGKGEMSTAWDYDAALAESFQSTFGALVTRFGEVAASDYQELYGQLERAVESRNDLAHHYFWDRALQFSSTKGRENMIEELTTLGKHFESLDAKLTRLTRDITEQKGLSKESLRISIRKAMTDLQSGIAKPYRPQRVPNRIEITAAYEWRAGAIVKSGLVLQSKDGEYLIIGEKGLCYGPQDIPVDELVLRTEFAKALPAELNPRSKKSAPWTFAFVLANGYVLSTRPDFRKGNKVCRFALKRHAGQSLNMEGSPKMA